MRMSDFDLPPVSNRALYCMRVFMKLFSFFLFGIGTIVLVGVLFPVMRLCIHPRERFRRDARRLVSLCMRFFTGIMYCLGVVRLEPGDRAAYQRFASKIVVANHPSLLDVVMLLSLIPNADCIVQGSLSRNIVAGVVRQLYILNYLDFDRLSAACISSLREGNCIIIFPEGTRTPRSAPVKLKKGAARLSLLSGCGIVPIRICGTDKYGLGKHDPWLAFNHTDPYMYTLHILPEIFPDRYEEIPAFIASKKLTDDISASLFPDSC